MKQPFCSLVTPFETKSSTSWEKEYPRPLMRRDSYLSLCGDWDLWVLNKTQEQSLGTIRVPFAPESRLSGVERQLQKGERYRYQKTFSLSEEWVDKQVLVHFGAVDQIARVWVNEQWLGEHQGGYLPFSFNITSYLQAGENTLTVEVIDQLDLDFPYGKQRKNRGGMWYTPISGIWQPVWLEGVPQDAFTDLSVVADTEKVTVYTKGGKNEKILKLADGTEIAFNGDRVTFSPEHPHLWSPEDPYLYEFTLTDGTDTVASYFAMRTITSEVVAGRSTLCLNGNPYFFHGLLDQGYFSDGIYLPATPDGYLFDILKMKELGFNMLRKHIKIEPQLFYYYCDKYGMVVFQDMVNNGKYHFIYDTALPTVGLKRLPKPKASKRRKELFESHCKETVELLANHPSVCYYTIFNEGWGQYDSDRIYGELQAKDPTRVWDATSGWFFRKQSDVQSEHVYFRKVVMKPANKPLVLSEFGGYVCKIDGHIFNENKDYGYKTCQSVEQLQRDLLALYREQIIPAIQNGLCAAVYTQVSDVEDEINGLVTYDRQVVKVEPAAMRELKQELQQAFEQVYSVKE